MRNAILALLSVATPMALSCANATAQTVEPTFLAAPDVYKVLFEDANFRVVEATRKGGVRDKAHSHPLPSVVYNLTDRSATQVYDAAGKPTPRPSDATGKVGSVSAVPVIVAHSAENTGTTDCKQLFVNRK